MTNLTRVSTYAQHSKLITNVTDTQARLGFLQNQISSGRKSENFAGFAGRVEFITSLENKIRGANQYIESNTVIKTRLKTMDVAITNIMDLTTDLRDLIAGARSPYITEKGVLIQQAQSMLNSLSNQLNANLGGRYLFAGSKTDSPPVLESIPDTLVPNTADDGYYTGDNVDLKARFNDKFETVYGVRANDQGFQDLVLAIKQTITAIDTGSFEGLENAFATTEVARERILSIQTQINNNIVNIDTANDEHQTLKLYWKGISDTELNTDTIEASTQVAIDQALLQAAFQAFAKISSLKLSDFI